MRTRLRGFTIIELIVVMAIIGILATLITINLTNAKYKANYTRVLADMDSIADAARLYKQEKKEWPANVNRNTLPTDTAFSQYLPSWPKTPCPGLCYDYDNYFDPPATQSQIGITIKYCPSANIQFNTLWPPDTLYYYDISNFTSWINNGDSPLPLDIRTMETKTIVCPAQRPDSDFPPPSTP